LPGAPEVTGAPPETTIATPIDIDAIPLQVTPATSPIRAPASEPVHVAPVSLEPAPHDAPLEVEPARVVEPLADTRAAEPMRPRNLPEIPPVQLALPPDSGLELVETRHHIEMPPVEEEVPRARRSRPPRVAIPDEPLQMVETRDDAGRNPPA
jgi:hypothetical protein